MLCIQVVSIYQRRRWHPTPVLLPGKSCGRKNLVAYSPWGHKELDTTEHTHTAKPDIWTQHLKNLSTRGKSRVNKDCFIIWIWRRRWHPTPVLLPGESHGWRGLVGCSPWGHWDLDTTEWLHFHFSLSCIGKGNGNPLQCSSLENPRDGGAWWAAIYGVTQSQTWLKWLSSSSSKEVIILFLLLFLQYSPWSSIFF